MALRWILGDFKTGNISESAVLPVIANGDTVDLDINSGDTATLTLSRADLPSDWRTYLKPIDKFVALVDDTALFSSAVLWAGRIDKYDGEVKGVVKIFASGVRDWLATRIITTVYNTTATNPTAGVTFTASTWQGVMRAIIEHAFSNVGIPAGAPTNPTILGTVSGTVSGTTVSLTALNSDQMKYAEALDEVRDTLSSGNEYRFNARWASSAKTQIVWDAVIGTSGTGAHIGESTTLNISLADNTWKPIKFGQSASSVNQASRIVGHSVYGEGTTGSDFTTRTSTTGTTILVDQTFNPGVPLTAAEMTAQLDSRLSFNSTSNKEAVFERSFDTLTELRTAISQLGNMATFTGTAEAAQFGATMRIVGLSFAPEKKKIRYSLLPKAAKYPTLPKDRRNNLGGGGSNTDSGGGNSTSPLSPPPYKYVPPVAPPFQLPKDNFTEAESILETVDMRHFSTYNSGDTAAIADTWHKFPDVTRSRFNYETGEMIGLATASRALYGFGVGSGYKDAYVSSDNWKSTTGTDHNKNLDIYSVDIPGMFDRDSNPYMNLNSRSPIVADNFKKKIGTIPYSMYSELEIDPVTFKAKIPITNISGRPRATAVADYNMFCTQDLKTIFVQVIVTTSISQIDANDTAGGWKSYSSTLSKVIKGVRGTDGLVVSWESLGDIFSINKEDMYAQKTFFSTAIYEIDGQFHAFGGFLIPLAEENVKAPTVLPGYELKFYQHGHMIVNVDNFIYSPSEIDLPGLTMLDTGSPDQSIELLAKYPYAINVDYSQNKLSIGISRGANGKLSQYFYSDFSNLLSFKKILSTDRETAITWNTQSIGRTQTGTEIKPFRFRSKAPIFYKNNFFLFNGSSENSTGSLNKNFINKKINHIRGKVGFEDTVAGALSFNNYSFSNTDKAKDVYVVYNSTASSANDLGSFGNYYWRAYNSPNEPSNVLGMEYFIYNGFLYMICDTTFTEYEFPGPGTGTGEDSASYKYWIGKFRIKDSIL